MIKLVKNKYLLFYFIISIFYMELIIRLATMDSFFSIGLLYSFLFSVFFAVIFFIISSCSKKKLNHIFASILLGFSAIIFSSQLVYFKIFRIFYTAYSLTNASQVFEFWKDICTATLQNSLWILLIFLPFILIVIKRPSFLSFNKINSSFRFSLIYSLVVIHVFNLTVISFGNREDNSAYDLYFKNSYPNISTEKLGLVTTMRIDIQRLVSNWAPVLEASANELTDYNEYGDDAYLKETNSSLLNASPTQNHHSLEILDEDSIESKIIEYNTMDIDFDYIISNEKDTAMKDMHTYFKNVAPTKKNDYTGIYEGYNLIFITAESFSSYAIDENITPTLYKLVNEGYNFTNFYNPLWGVSTSDGEYVACTSLLPKNGVWSFYHSGKNYMPFTMGNQLKDLGYKAIAYHNHSYSYYRRDVSHPNMGYEYKAVGNGLDITETWPESDVEMMEKTIPEYINNQPFHAYYMTVSGHMQYNFFGNAMAKKNKKYVEDLDYLTAGKAYIATQIELDRALEHLLAQLEEAGIADKTLIALSPDHYPYGLKDDEINDLAGHDVEKNFEIYKNTFILYTKDMEPVTIDKPCSSLDIIPTLSNLLGLEYDSRLLMGKDIFSDSNPLVIFLNKSFITDKGLYNSVTKEFIPNKGVEVDKEYIDIMSAIVKNKFYYSAKILGTDYYRRIFENQ